MQTVLVVDDEESIRTLVAYNFERAGYRVHAVPDGREAYEFIRAHANEIHLVILDLMLPGMDGMEVCRRLRSERVDIPIVLLTARDEELDLVLGLELGADDYVTKPFSPRELVARARAVLRRVDGPASSSVDEGSRDGADVMAIGEITMNKLRHEVTHGGAVLELTPKQFDLLQILMENKGHVLSRDQLLDRVWGYGSTTDTRIVDVHMSHLRDKLEADPKNPRYIRTVRGIGYKFTDSADVR